MPNGEASSLPLVSLTGEWFRLIPSRFPPISIYERVIANDRLNELVAVENLTNPRVKTATLMTSGLVPVDPSSPALQNWNLAPFTYPNPEGSYFFRKGFSVLELSENLQAALATSVRRRELFLRRTREPPIDLEMRVLKTPVSGDFVDLRQSPPFSEEDRWKVGDSVVRQNLDGALFSSPDREGSSCIAVLKESKLGRSEQTKHFKFRWDGERFSSIVAFGEVEEFSPDIFSSGADFIANLP